MRRIFCLSLLLLVTLCLHAQEAEGVALWDDSVAVDSLAADEVPMVDEADTVADVVAAEAPVVEIPPYMRRSVMRSWRRVHPTTRQGNHPYKHHYVPSVSSLLDSLRLAVSLRDPQLSAEMRYLYDMRLPVISSGSVPSDSITSLAQLVEIDEQQTATDQLPIAHPDELYERQLLNEEQRHRVRFNYASVDPRRFRYARRPFDVPTSDSRTIDTRSTVQGLRLVDDIDVNFGNTAIEDFDRTFLLKADRWHWKGDHTLTMQQTALTSNWYNGGDNNMSVSGEQKLTVTRYDEDSKVTFEGVLDLKLSGYYTKADTIHRMRVSDNEFTLSLKYGYKAWKKWYYSAQLYAKTPVFDFYSPNSKVCKSTFLSPLEMNLAFGVDYKYTSPNKKFTYSLLLAPLSYDMKYVNDPRVNVTSYKIKEGETSLHNFGSTVTTKFDWKMGQNATWSSRLYYFTTYHAMKVEFENTFNFKISRFFTTRIYLYPRFDDALDAKAEVKEMLTVGFSYAW